MILPQYLITLIFFFNQQAKSYLNEDYHFPFSSTILLNVWLECGP